MSTFQALFFGSLFALSACNASIGTGQENHKANVNCAADDKGEIINCTVQHTEGSRRLKVCWDLQFECANGTLVTGDGCQEVDPKESQVHKIPVNKLTNFQDCDKVAKSEVLNLKLSEPGQP